MQDDYTIKIIREIEENLMKADRETVLAIAQVLQIKMEPEKNTSDPFTNKDVPQGETIPVSGAADIKAIDGVP